MPSLDTNLLIAIGVVAIVIVLALLGWSEWRKHRSKALERRFGPEYRRAVDAHGSRDKAEAELAARARRVERFRIVPLAASDAARFGESWRALQGRFVDDPRGAVAEADRLIREVMTTRGYPMSDFERSAADLSVSHPRVVSHYRAAHAIVAGDAPTDTESLRKAVVHYRALFTELLETRDEAGQRADNNPRFRTQP